MDDYHNYVIRDGNLVGNFEEMYKNCDDPWHQSESNFNELSYSRNIAILAMKRFGIKSVVDFGCGLGYYTKMINNSGIDVLGVDISDEAISKARNLFPNLKFQVGKIQDMQGERGKKYFNYDAILLSEIVWYILPDFDSIIETLAKLNGKYLINNLVFYKGSQQYGLEYFTNLDEFITHVPYECVFRSESTAKDDISIETCSVFKI